MRLFARLLASSNRPWLWMSLGLAALAVALQFLPLTRELHYEFSASIAVAASIAAGFAALVAWWRAPALAPVEATTRAIACATLATLPALLIALAHAALSGFCGAGDGVLWFLVLAPPSAAIGAAVARLAHDALRRRWVSVLALIGLWAASMFRGAYEAITGPHIFLYAWQVGFFPGGSWDPELPITPTLLVYRVAQLLIASLLLLLLFEIDAVRTGKARRGAGLALPAVLVAALICVLVPARSKLGLTRTDTWLREELGDSVRTRFTTIYYHAPSTDSLDIWRAANYADFSVTRHARALGIPPGSIEPITFYAFASAAEQKRLVGTSSASFTKPWRRALSLSFDRVEGTLDHELAHIVLAPYGNVLGISWSNGILEGAAVALEHADDARMLDAHARAAYNAGLAPPIGRLMSATGFASQRSSLSYMLAGSFCRWLIDTYGARRFRDAYASGALEPAYGRTIEQLEREWRTHLSSLEPTPPAMALTTRYLYAGGSFFAQRCLRRLATLSGEGFRALAEERYDEALDRFRRSLEEGITSSARAGIVRALHGAGRFRELLDSMAVYERDTAGYWTLPYGVEVSDAMAARGAPERERAARLRHVLTSAGEEWTRVRAGLRLLLASRDTTSWLWDSTSALMLRSFSATMSPLARFAILADVRARIDRRRPAWRLREELVRLMQAMLIARQNPRLAIVVAEARPPTGDSPIHSGGALPAHTDPDSFDRMADQLPDTLSDTYAYVRAELWRGLLDAAIVAAIDVRGRVDAPRVERVMLSAYSALQVDRLAAGDLVGPERPRSTAESFMEYLRTYGAIDPWARTLSTRGAPRR